jgi:hypothetical protein
MTTYTQKITFGEMRESGVRDVLIYRRDHRCSHHVETNADGWADDVRLSDIEPNSPVQHAAAKKARTCGPKFPVVSQFEIQPQETFQMTMIRSLAIVVALCLFGTSASATTMQECRAKYKAAQTKSGAGLSWVSFQERKCGIKAKAHAPKPAHAAPLKH